MPEPHHWPPMPPIEMPPARTVLVPGRGEFFIRDTGGNGQPVMLLHGWMATADLNWWSAYDDLAGAGYRVLAIDHRGHGRGLRSLAPFRLADCAADAAAVVRRMKLDPAVFVGYSMGGAIAQLVARNHAEVARGIVLSGTAQHWQDSRSRRSFRAMGAFGLLLTVAPRALFRAGLKRSGLRPGERTAWLQSELIRHSATDIAEAGRELGRFDSRPWLGYVTPPVAVLITTKDQLVSPRKQRGLAAAAAGPTFEAPIDHLDLGVRKRDFNPHLVRAIAAVASVEDARAA